MFTKFLLPLASVAGVCFAVYSVVQARQTPPPNPPFRQPVSRPDLNRLMQKVMSKEIAARHLIAGAGIVEASKENIPIGTHLPGVVTEVFVKVSDRVKQGDKLFKLDDRAILAELATRQAELASAQAQLHRLEAAPRAEDLPPLRSAVQEDRARLLEAESGLARSERLRTQQMIPASDYDKDRYAVEAARAALQKAIADLQKVEAGSWAEDIAVARAAVAGAEAHVLKVKTDLERLTVTALTDGEVLQVNVRPGQYAALAWKEPLIVLGDLHRYHVRIDIDENDLPMFRRSARAVATLRGRPADWFLLEPVKVEPYVIPKRSLTGDNTERVDTRVLQVVYALPEETGMELFVGQQMDAYLEASAPTGEDASEAIAKIRSMFEEAKSQASAGTSPEPVKS